MAKQFGGGKYVPRAQRTTQGKDFELILTFKINPVRGLTVDFSQLTFVPTWKSRDTKTRPNIKNPDLPDLNMCLAIEIPDKLLTPT